MIYALEMTIFATLSHTFRDCVRHQSHQAAFVPPSVPPEAGQKAGLLLK